MVLLAAAVCTKQGKALVSRQFLEMTRPRIEGLLSAFPKLMSGGKQHTFVETESVRYVYQSLDKLYILIITTKESNILEDLETLRLFSRVVPEYCSNFDEDDVLEHCFELISAMDEMVALGYRESINLSQIRQYTEMVSHDEQVYLSMRKTQEKQAKEKMKEKAKEIKQAKKEAMKSGRYPGGGIGGGFGGGMGSSSMGTYSETTPSYVKPTESSYKSSRSSTTKAMKLGKKGRDVDSFVDKLINEGEKVSSMSTGKQSSMMSAKSVSAVQHSSVHLKVMEKMTVSCGPECVMDVNGVMQLTVTDQDHAHINIEIDKDEDSGIQYNTHPNINKQLFAEQSLIALKSEGKSFPLKSEVPLLKYRFHSTNEDHLPIKISCWPSQMGDGCEVTIEYELQQEHMSLADVVISIPLPAGVGAPVVGECEGEYNHDSRKHILNWTIPVMDSSNANGSMEFTVPGTSDDFFPIKAEFVSATTFCQIRPVKVVSMSGDQEVKFSSESSCIAENYEFK